MQQALTNQYLHELDETANFQRQKSTGSCFPDIFHVVFVVDDDDESVDEMF